MDLTRDVTYRSVELNDAATTPGGRIVGNQLQSVQWLPIRAHGYTEKRSGGDGRDASDVFLDGRQLILDGITYGDSRGDTFDRLQAVKSAFTPTRAYIASPSSYGYLPLYYFEPTEDIADWPTGVRSLYVNVRPTQGLGFDIVRDRSGGKDARGLGVPWRAFVDAIDPRVYVTPAVFIDFTPDDTDEAGDLVNRGDYPAPLNIMLVVAPQAKPGFFVFTGAGASMTISIPQSANTQIIRYNGTLKVLTVEELGVESLRRGLLDLGAEDQHPLVQPGTTPYSWTSVWSGGGSTYQTIPMADGSRIFYSESFS